MISPTEMSRSDDAPSVSAATAAPPDGSVGAPAAAASLRGVELVYRNKASGRVTHALSDISFEIGAAEFVAVVGPSGCGKSTLLNLLAGLMAPTAGEIRLRGQRVSGLQKSLGYVTQDSNLLPWLTVDANMRLPLKIRRWPKERQDAEIARWLEIVGLKGFETAYPRQLSGGMQKRCSIARTLVYDPDILLMDEPFGAVDAITRSLLQDTLLKIWTARPKTVLFITHDLSEALALADKVVIMTRRPGRVKEIVPVAIPRPRDVFHLYERPEFAVQQRALWDLFNSEI